MKLMCGERTHACTQSIMSVIVKCCACMTAGWVFGACGMYMHTHAHGVIWLFLPFSECSGVETTIGIYAKKINYKSNAGAF